MVSIRTQSSLLKINIKIFYKLLTLIASITSPKLIFLAPFLSKDAIKVSTYYWFRSRPTNFNPLFNSYSFISLLVSKRDEAFLIFNIPLILNWFLISLITDCSSYNDYASYSTGYEADSSSAVIICHMFYKSVLFSDKLITVFPTVSLANYWGLCLTECLFALTSYSFPN